MQNSQVAHEWAHGHEAKGSNFFTDGDRIYSYGRHFIAAQRYPGGVVLISSDTYSPSTQRHLSLIRSAARHLITFEVPYPDAEDDGKRHEENADHLEELADGLAKKAIRSRNYTDIRWGEHKEAVEQHNEYTRRFCPGVPPIDVMDEESLKGKIAKERAENKEKRAKENKEKAVREARDRAVWVNHEEGTEHQNLWGHKRQYLRVLTGPRADRYPEPMVQSSQGAYFPVAAAKRAWVFINRVYDQGSTYKRAEGGKAIRIGQFVLDEIRADGTVIAGCHTIDRDEIERFAKVLGLL
jgi:hypothetical protein